MKVLWFSNTPANASEFLKNYSGGGGWLKALDFELQSHIQLHIAFYYPFTSSSFRFGNTIYHPIVAKNWKLKAVREALFDTVTDDDDLGIYLQIIDDVQPELIHIHGTENPFGCIIGRTSLPVVISIQGIVSCIHNKFAIGLSRSELNNWSLNLSNGLRSLIFERSFLRSYRVFELMKRREVHNLRGARYIIGRTEWDRRVCSVLAPNGVYFHGDEIMRPGFYEAQWSDRNAGQLVIHSTSGDRPYKGFETICEALYELSFLKDLNVEWRIAGLDMESRIVKIVKRRLGKRFPSKGLVLMGNLRESELIESLLESSIFVSTSHIENSSNSLCEAMLLGLPCLATFAGGTPNIIKDGEEGVLCQDGDPLALVGAILELYSDKEKAYEFGKRARARAQLRHSKGKIVADLLNTYKEIVDRKEDVK